MVAILEPPAEIPAGPARLYQDGGGSSPLEPIDSETEDHEASLTQYEILTYPADYPLEVLVDKRRKEQIVIPQFQRQFVWTKTQASKLIDSFLIGLPVPPVYVFADIDKPDKLQVVDGQQRIKSIQYFFDGHFGDEQQGSRTVFRLTGLNEDSPYNGLTYQELRSVHPAAFTTLNNSILRVFVVRQLDPKDDTSIFHIFERLNTGGTQLSTQEIRNCILHGPFNDMLVEANKYEPWRDILGKPTPDKRQRDVELILRFFALNERLDDYKKPMKDFLNNFMQAHRNVDDNNQLENFKNLFEQTVDVVTERLKEKPFHIRHSGLNVAVFDSVFVTIAQLSNIPDDLDQRYQQLIKNESFLDCTRARTTNKETVLERMSIASNFFNNV